MSTQFPQVYAGVGFVVAMINVRGSFGRGYNFSEAIYRDWAYGPSSDIVGAINYLGQNMKYIDVEDLHGMGSFYGGYLGMYLTSQIPNFKSWVINSAVYDLPLFAETSNTGYSVTNAYFGGNPIDPNIKTYYDRNNPAKYASNMTTPSLVVHGSKNTLVNEDQQLKYYFALSTNEVPAEYVVYPTLMKHSTILILLILLFGLLTGTSSGLISISLTNYP